MRNANGIMIDTILSIPMFTPRLTINPVASTEIKKYANGSSDEVKEEKVTVEPRREKSRYARVQPIMTR